MTHWSSLEPPRAQHDTGDDPEGARKLKKELANATMALLGESQLDLGSVFEYKMTSKMTRKTSEHRI